MRQCQCVLTFTGILAGSSEGENVYTVLRCIDIPLDLDPEGSHDVKRFRHLLGAHC